MSRYVRLEEAIRRCGLPRPVVDELLEDEVIVPRPTLDEDRVISSDEADELRVVTTLMDELGVNVAGVEVILHMRRQQLALRREVDALIQSVRDELLRRLRDPAFFGPAGFLPPPGRGQRG
jgi:MerR family transcriptional regulator/heat shock protein HspR